MPAPPCPFCEPPASHLVAHNALAFALRDRFPVSQGHTLIIPRRHVADWWAATEDERRAVDALLEECKRALDAAYAPDGYNIGVNNGAAAGQTVHHLHVHLIPRYDGDLADPRGGVRHVMPGRGNWMAAASAPPSPAEDAASGASSDLMQRVLSILQEGRRSATYKPALLLALTELAVERAEGADALTLPLTDVAEQVMELYWPQTRPHPATGSVPLRQGSGRSLRIPDVLSALRRESGAGANAHLSHIRQSHPRDYLRARDAVARALAKQPVPRLQRPGSSVGLDDYQRFLYDDSRYRREGGALDRAPVVTLRRGVAQGLARNAPLIRIAAQDEWVEDVAGFNGLRLEEAALRDFLFGSRRSRLRPVADGLRDLGIRHCFWCDRVLGDEVEVDHVVPWSHYPHDDLSNLVLTDRHCNNDKRDRLVATDLLRRWVSRDGAPARSLARDLQWPCDPDRSRAVARTSYRYLATGMPLWRGRRSLSLYSERDRTVALHLLEAAPIG